MVNLWEEMNKDGQVLTDCDLNPWNSLINETDSLEYSRKYIYKGMADTRLLDPAFTIEL